MPSIPGGALASAFVSRKFYQVGPQGATLIDDLNSIKSFPSSRRFSWPSKAVALGDHELGVFELAAGNLNVLDIASGSWHSKRLNAQEILNERTPERTGNQATATISSIAPDASSGSFYIAKAPFYLTEGAPILQFDHDGNVLRRFRCKLPVLPSLRTNRNKSGQFSLSQIFYVSHKLLLVSESQRFVLIYGIS